MTVVQLEMQQFKSFGVQADVDGVPTSLATALANPNDTLTLVARGLDWVELARSINS